MTDSLCDGSVSLGTKFPVVEMFLRKFKGNFDCFKPQILFFNILNIFGQFPVAMTLL